MESEHFSPVFPNPVSCFLTIISHFNQELFNRYPRNGIGNWLKETWEWHYLAFYIGWTELAHIACIAIGLTLLRIVLNTLIIKPLPKYFNIIEQDAEKFPESFWKSIIYIVTWFWALYLCCVSDEMYFFKLDNHWEDYRLGNAIPSNIYWLYMLQIGFYFHCIYASVYLETIRRDFLALMFHHFLTLGLLFYSYGVRLHLIGLLVLFIHDIGDLILEVSKTILYFKTRNGADHALPKFLADIGFAFFTIQWILFRLYWFLTKVLYSSAYVSMKVYSNGPFYLSFNIMLLTLYLLQVYWFTFIMRLLIKLIIKGGKVEDPRELNENEVKKKN